MNRFKSCLLHVAMSIFKLNDILLAMCWLLILKLEPKMKLCLSVFHPHQFAMWEIRGEWKKKQCDLKMKTNTRIKLGTKDVSWFIDFMWTLPALGISATGHPVQTRWWRAVVVENKHLEEHLGLGWGFCFSPLDPTGKLELRAVACDWKSPDEPCLGKTWLSIALRYW